MLRLSSCLVLLVAAAVLAPGGAAAAGGFAPKVWPGGALPYRDLTGAHGYHAAVQAAVTAWNRAGVGIRLVRAAPQQAAAVQVVFSSGRCLSGRAGGARVGYQRFGSRIVVRSCPAVVRPLLVAHELGLVLGLRTDDSRCSLMNSHGKSDGLTFALPSRCSQWHRPAWLPGLVDPFSVARARRIYTPPHATGPLALTAGDAPRIDWRQPPRTGAVQTIVARMRGVCPERADVADGRATIVYDKRGFAGNHWLADSTLPAARARWCYRAFNASAFGRLAPSPNTVSYAVDVPPTAAFTVATAGPLAGAATTFADTSNDPDGSVVHWHWDFGDPASAAANVVDTGDPVAGRQPSHVYAQPGSYVVTLTVTDDGGRTATTSATVVVAAQ